MSDSWNGSLLSKILPLKSSIRPNSDYKTMVLSIVDQHKPKCYLCSNIFENIEELRKHQEIEHKDFVEFHKNRDERSPAPGDVSIF